MTADKKILFAVSGGIAAYKAADLVSKLVQKNFSVQVVMTQHAQKLVGPATFRSLSNNPVITDLFGDESLPIPHINITESADLCIVAPATANIIGKIAGGIADDSVTTSVLACPAPKLIVPSMNTEMWNNPLVQENIQKLKKLGYFFIEPDYGHLACGTEGKGRYPENSKILELIESILIKKKACNLQGKKILITSGGTKEQIDPVRIITNKSSGKMGQALKNAALLTGAEVNFIEAQNVTQLKNDIEKSFNNTDVLIMAAAVSDYKPKKQSTNKIKSDQENLTIELEKTEDILNYFGQKKQKQYLVGFCLETENLKENALKKLKNKNLDLIIANDISAIGSDQSSVLMIDKNQEITEYKNLEKSIIAEKILERICRDLNK